MMDIKLFFQALSKFLIGLIIICILLFIPAGTINYPNGWLFIALLFIPMGIIMIFKSPDLLRRRLNAKENEDEQKTVILISGIIFLLAFILAGLNFRFGWFNLPSIVVIIASVIFLLAYIMYAEVLRENEYLSRIVMLVYPIMIMFRIRNEERVLENELIGYEEYKEKVKYKLIPYLW